MLTRRHPASSLLTLLTVIGLLLAPLGSASAASQTGSQSAQLQQAFERASREFHVPLAVLLSVSYNESRWDQHQGQPSASGAYGVMGLTDLNAATSEARGEGSIRRSSLANDPSLHTLNQAARLIGASPSSLKRDPSQNIRGGAALLAKYEQQLVGGTPSDPAKWYGAVVKYSGSIVSSAAMSFGDDVYATIRYGASRTTPSGQKVALAGRNVQPDRSTAKRLHLRNPKTNGAECPPGLACQFIPAAYQQNNPDDPTDYGNYDLANRPADGLKIQYIVIHDTETSYNDAINIFQNPLAYVSAHYVVRSSDGLVTQMVPTKDVAWHAGNWYVNMHSIGIEHEGFAVEGATWYTEQMYHSSARLVKYLAHEYSIPLDREHILGHDNVPGPTPAYQAGMHWDPGPYWDWAHYMALLGAPINPSGSQGNPRSNTITIDPNFHTNEPVVTYNGKQLPAQPTDFVYLHTAPSADAPLLGDPALHPDGSTGTTEAYDWGDKAVTGQRFYVAGRQGDWTGIYYGGTVGWFYNPRGSNAVPSSGVLITPKQGLSSIPVYGRAYPEASAYDGTGVPAQPIRPMQYTIPAGQVYVAAMRVNPDYYYAWFYNQPDTYRVIIGHEQYYEISFNHRIAYVKASDVDVVGGR